jgi:hypothetical protein
MELHFECKYVLVFKHAEEQNGFREAVRGREPHRLIMMCEYNND